MPRESPHRVGRAWIFPALLVLAIALAYSNSLGGAFVFDDWRRILEDPDIRDFPRCLAGSSRPLTQLTFYLNYRLGGFHAPDFRLVNIALHMAAALLLYGLVRRSLELPGARDGASMPARELAGWTALLWALHPVQTESVTYVVQRAEALMGLFFLATLYAFVRSVQAENRSSRLWQLGAISACVFGTLSKPPMVVAPLAVLLFDRTFVSANAQEALRRRAGFYGMLFGSWALLAWLALRPNESSQTTGFAAQPLVLTPWEYLVTQLEVIPHYIRLSVAPSALCLDYAWPPAAPGWRLFLSAAVVVAVVVTAAAMAWRRRRIGFLLAWFLLVLVPTSSFMPIADCAAEHRLYLALAAVSLLVVLGADCAITRWVARRRIPTGATRYLVGFAAVAVAATVGMLTRDRNCDYASEETMWRDVFTKRPQNFRAGSAWTGTLLERGAFADAERAGADTVSKVAQTMRNPATHRIVAARAAEAYPVLLDQLARALSGMGRPQEALEYYREAIRASPSYAIARNNMALALLGLNRADEAKAAIERPADLPGQEAMRQYVLGLIMERLHRDGEAAVAYERAIGLQVGLALPRVRLAWLRIASTEDSVRDPERAVPLIVWLLRNSDAGSPRILDLQAASLASRGLFDEAALAQREAIRRQREVQSALPQAASKQSPDRETAFLLPAGDSDSMQERLTLYLRREPYRFAVQGLHREEVLKSTAP